MPEALKVIQITDPHLRGDPAAELHGWNVQRAWRRVFDDARRRHPDADVWALTGDLVDDESERGYTRLNHELAQVQQPILALAGNHDDPAIMRRRLLRAHVHACIDLGGWRLHALNSHIDGSDAGRIGTRQLQDLQMALANDARPCVVFVHHPPIALDSQWLDAIGLHDAAALCRLISAHRHIAAVVYGHVHQAFASHIGHVPCWGTPSTMRQFLPGADDFATDTEARPGYRVIRLHANGTASSTIQRLAPACG